MNSAMIFYLAKTVLSAAGIGVACAFLIWYLYRSIYAGLVLVLVLYVTETAAAGLPYFSVGVSAYPSDIVFLLVGVAAMFRVGRLPVYSKTIKIWFFVGGLLMASFIFGALKFGTSAGVEFRQYYYFWVGALYFGTFAFSEQELERTVQLWNAAAAVLVLVVIYRWIVQFSGGDTSGWAALTGTATLRVVSADKALFIAEALVMTVYLRMRSASLYTAISLSVFIIAVLVLQHRTLWVVTLACLAAVFYLERKVRGRLAGNLAAVVVVAFTVLVPLLIVNNQLDVVTQSLEASVAEAQGEHSTLVWRVQGWEELLKTWASSGPWQYLFGAPFGNGTRRYLPGVAQEITVAAHNHYVQTLLRIGLLGLVALLAVYRRALSVLYRSSDSTHAFPRRGLLVLLLGQLIYFITYSPDYMQGILLGVVLAVIARDELAATEHRGLASMVRV